MRKEVKIGFTIGGILLSVLVVYVLVITGGSDQPADQVTLVTNADSAAASDQTAAKPPQPPVEETSKLVEPATKPGESAIDPFKSVAAAPDENERWAGGVLQTGLPVLMSETPAPSPKVNSPLVPIPAEANRPTPDAARRQDGVSNRPESIPQAGNSDPASPRQTTPRLTTPRTHVIQQGETFYTISAAVYGSSAYFVQIQRANPNVDPTRMRPGTVINLPAITDVRADGGIASARTQAARIDPKTEYKVQDGDNLHKIALKLYGKTERADQIYDLNRGLIGSDPGRLKVGTVLKLPEAPKVQ